MRVSARTIASRYVSALAVILIAGGASCVRPVPLTNTPPPLPVNTAAVPPPSRYLCCTAEESRTIIADRAAAVIDTLRRRDFRQFSTFVHPRNGVRFSPYAFVDSENDIVLSAATLRNTADRERTRTWGAYDGTGDPITRAFTEYFHRFIFDRDFSRAETVSYNRPLGGGGNTLNNIPDVYPNAIVVEYYFSGFNPTFAGLDWKSLRIVFEAEGGTWYVVGIVHDEWTI